MMPSEDALTATQCVAARKLLNITRVQLAARAGLGDTTIGDFERGKPRMRALTICLIRSALEADGIAFIPENRGGAGVRLRQP